MPSNPEQGMSKFSEAEKWCTQSALNLRDDDVVLPRLTLLGGRGQDFSVDVLIPFSKSKWIGG